MNCNQQITCELCTLFNHFHNTANYKELCAVASHLNNFQGCLSSIKDGVNDVNGWNLKTVLY